MVRTRWSAKGGYAACPPSPCWDGSVWQCHRLSALIRTMLARSARLTVCRAYRTSNHAVIMRTAGTARQGSFVLWECVQQEQHAMSRRLAQGRASRQRAPSGMPAGLYGCR